MNGFVIASVSSITVKQKTVLFQIEKAFDDAFYTCAYINKRIKLDMFNHITFCHILVSFTNFICKSNDQSSFSRKGHGVKISIVSILTILFFN